MAVLPNEDRVNVWSEYMQELSRERQTVGGSLTKAQLRAAVDAMDDWVNTNSTAFNTAIPQPARGVLTSSQKAQLLMFVIRKRFFSGV